MSKAVTIFSLQLPVATNLFGSTSSTTMITYRPLWESTEVFQEIQSCPAIGKTKRCQALVLFWKGSISIFALSLLVNIIWFWALRNTSASGEWNGETKQLLPIVVSIHPIYNLVISSLRILSWHFFNLFVSLSIEPRRRWTDTRRTRQVKIVVRWEASKIIGRLLVTADLSVLTIILSLIKAVMGILQVTDK